MKDNDIKEIFSISYDSNLDTPENDDNILQKESFEKDNNNIDNTNNNQIKNENTPLIIREEKIKKNLKDIFENMKNILDSEDNLNKNTEAIFNNLLNNSNDAETTIRIKVECCLCFMFYFICPILTIINLIGIFQVISVMKIISNVVKQSVLCYIKIDKCIDKDVELYKFFDYFFFESLNESVDYNLMMIFGFLGNILLGAIGFIISSIIFLLINVGSLFMIYCFDFDDYNKDTNKYNFFQLLYLLGIFVLLLVGVGGSALLSQQILLDSFSKYQKSINKEKKNDLTFFFFVCLITILGYFFKYLINILLSKLFEDNDDKKLYFLLIIIIYGSSILISLIIYFFFKFIFNKGQDDNKKNENKKVYQIFGYLIYLEEKKNRKEIENIPCEWFRLPCKTISKCCDKSICDLLCCQDDKMKEEDKFHCCFSYCYNCKCCCESCYNCECCGKCCICCICCKCCCTCCKCNKIADDDYNEPNNIFYCNCYKIKRKSKWFDMFMNNKNQIQLTKIMLNYFILQLTTIGFEKIYNNNREQLKDDDNNKNKNILDFKNMLISCGIFLLSFMIFFSVITQN